MKRLMLVCLTAGLLLIGYRTYSFMTVQQQYYQQQIERQQQEEENKLYRSLLQTAYTKFQSECMNRSAPSRTHSGLPPITEPVAPYLEQQQKEFNQYIDTMLACDKQASKQAVEEADKWRVEYKTKSYRK